MVPDMRQGCRLDSSWAYRVPVSRAQVVQDGGVPVRIRTIMVSAPYKTVGSAQPVVDIHQSSCSWL